MKRFLISLMMVLTLATVFSAGSTIYAASGSDSDSDSYASDSSGTSVPGESKAEGYLRLKELRNRHLPEYIRLQHLAAGGGLDGRNSMVTKCKMVGIALLAVAGTWLLYYGWNTWSAYNQEAEWQAQQEEAAAAAAAQLANVTAAAAARLTQATAAAAELARAAAAEEAARVAQLAALGLYPQ